MAKKKDSAKKESKIPFSKYLVVNRLFTLRDEEGEQTDLPQDVESCIEDVEDEEFHNTPDEESMIGVYKLVKFIKVKRTVTRDVSTY